ncbi:MAG: hypothetical protein JRN20_12140 [Nitrososphaerota archaeon]|nr:hypothetical protein [Nitrososphaerota archaeon]
MATILESRINAKPSEKNAPPNGSFVEADRPRLKEHSRSPDFDFVVPLDESVIDRRSLDYLFRTVNIFSGRLVLVYITHRLQLPKGFLEYAKVEGIHDYESHFYNSLANQKMQEIGRRAESEGIEWTWHVHIGGLRGAIKNILQGKNRVLIAILAKTNGREVRFAKRFMIRDLSEFGVPVLVMSRHIGRQQLLGILDSI